MQQNKSDKEQRGEQEGVGRLHDETNQEHGHTAKTVSKDISEVDQQEGSMHNGTLGGNFNEDLPAQENKKD